MLSIWNSSLPQFWSSLTQLSISQQPLRSLVFTIFSKTTWSPVSPAVKCHYTSRCCSIFLSKERSVPLDPSELSRCQTSVRAHGRDSVWYQFRLKPTSEAVHLSHSAKISILLFCINTDWELQRTKLCTCCQNTDDIKSCNYPWLAYHVFGCVIYMFGHIHQSARYVDMLFFIISELLYYFFYSAILRLSTFRMSESPASLLTPLCQGW